MYTTSALQYSATHSTSILAPIASPLAAKALGDLGPLDQRETLAALQMPILSYVGGKDAVFDPAVCRSVADYSSNVTLVECAESGHAPFIEEREFYNHELLNFVAAQL